MTNTRIARVYPDLSEDLARVALLGETLTLARDMKLSRQEIDAKSTDAEQVADLLSRTGLVEEIESAEQTAATTVVELLTLVSEEDLEQGLFQGLLSSEDYQEALTAKRTMSLQRGRKSEREQEREQ